MRYEVLASGVPKALGSMIIEADSDMDAVFRAGILIGKGLRRRVKMGEEFNGLSSACIEGVFPTTKPIVKVHDPRYRREETPA
jgi:hypothetical protein